MQIHAEKRKVKESYYKLSACNSTRAGRCDVTPNTARAEAGKLPNATTNDPVRMTDTHL